MKGSELVMLTDPNSTMAEAYRALRTSLTYAGLDEPLRSIVIAPATPDKGSTAAVVANLGIAMARQGQRTIIADADLRHPQLHALFGLANGEGLSEAILLDAEATLPLTPLSVEGLQLLSAGHPPLNAADLLASRRMEALVRRLEKEAECLLFLAPAITAFTDAAVLARVCSGLVLTVQAGRTRRDRLDEAKTLLENWGVKTIGAVLLDARRHLWQRA